jgi:hypothetical protein
MSKKISRGLMYVSNSYPHIKRLEITMNENYDFDALSNDT